MRPAGTSPVGRSGSMVRSVGTKHPPMGTSPKRAESSNDFTTSVIGSGSRSDPTTQSQPLRLAARQRLRIELVTLRIIPRQVLGVPNVQYALPVGGVPGGDERV